MSDPVTNANETAPAVTDNAAPSEGAPAAPAEWASVLTDEGNRGVVTAKGWKTADDAIKSYSELERRLSEVSGKQADMITVPKPDAPKEEWDAFHAKMGRPEKPEGYALAKPEGVPDDFVYDQKSADWYRKTAHEVGIPASQATALHDAFVRQQVEAQKAWAAELDQRGNQATEALKREHGEAYSTKVDAANLAIRTLGGPAFFDTIKGQPIADMHGNVLSPVLVNVLAEWAELKGLKEGKIVQGNATPSSERKYAFYRDNPFGPQSLT